MADRSAFLAAIMEHPDDDAPSLVYADWLDERGEADRAEFIRLCCAGDDWPRIQVLRQALYPDMWWRHWQWYSNPNFGQRVAGRAVADFCRGSVAGIRGEWEYVRPMLDALAATEPLTLVTIYGRVPVSFSPVREHQRPVYDYAGKVVATDVSCSWHVCPSADAGPTEVEHWQKTISVSESRHAHVSPKRYFDEEVRRLRTPEAWLGRKWPTVRRWQIVDQYTNPSSMQRDPVIEEYFHNGPWGGLPARETDGNQELIDRMFRGD